MFHNMMQLAEHLHDLYAIIKCHSEVHSASNASSVINTYLKYDQFSYEDTHNHAFVIRKPRNETKERQKRGTKHMHSLKLG